MNIRDALRVAVELYAEPPALDFRPLALKAVHRRMVDSGLRRTLVNRRVGAIVRMFKWAVSEQLLPSSAWESPRTVGGLAAGGAADVRESEPVMRSTTPMSRRRCRSCPRRSAPWSKFSG
ncbi:hypothetical protein [Paludisphaera mucosa]|uniref:Core-binding (CB) domain-containing protein n=1 Tax=Paludisphaera mucosa TaxID=3030827 RepID=A0ABT6FJD8_9BACT|nr:hypothetical protein [Paludisphaera mucosa]MDG3007696.1 hypothetical protein [Paludisphaera mucosa]